MNCRLLFGLWAVLFTAGGCASWRIGGPFGEPTTPTTRKPSPGARAERDKTDKPKDNKSQDEPATSRLATPPGTIADKSATATKPGDPVQAYIATELKDASAKEREEFTRLAQTDPTMAAYALRGRRMALAGSKSPAVAEKLNDLEGHTPAKSLLPDSAVTRADLTEKTAPGVDPKALSVDQIVARPESPSPIQQAGNRAPFAPVRAAQGTAGSTPKDQAPRNDFQNPVQTANSQQQSTTDQAVALSQRTAPRNPAAQGNLVPGQFNGAATNGSAVNDNVSPAQHQVNGGAMQAKKGAGFMSGLPVLQEMLGKPKNPVTEDAPTAKPGQLPNLAEDWRDSAAFQTVLDAAAHDAGNQQAGPDSDPDAYLKKHVHLRMLYLMNGQAERAVESIPGAEPADQMFWQQTFWGMHNYFDTKNIAAREDRATQTVQQFNTAAQRLQEKANLKLQNVAFCEQISSFGSYERFPQYEFSPGQQVLLYAEVENFHSEESDQGLFRTILKSTVEIYRAGLPGDPQKIELPVPATEDLCKNRRRDYFHTYEFVIPQRMAPGPHVLRLTVEDTLTHKIATSTVNFTVK